MSRPRCWCGKGRLYHRFRLRPELRFWHSVLPQLGPALVAGLRQATAEHPTRNEE